MTETASVPRGKELQGVCNGGSSSVELRTETEQDGWRRGDVDVCRKRKMMR